MTRLPLAAALLLGCALVGNAGAQDVTLLDRRLHLQPPPGYCIADESHAEREVVARVRKLIESQGPFLEMFVDCPELQRRRADDHGPPDGFDDYGTYSALTYRGQVLATHPETRQELLASIARAAGDDSVAPDAIDKVLKRLRDIGMTFTSTQNLGVLGLDDSAIYMGVVLSPRGPDDAAQQHVLSVGAITLVKGIRLSASWIRRYERPDDLPVLLADQKRAMSALVAANE